MNMPDTSAVVRTSLTALVLALLNGCGGDGEIDVPPLGSTPPVVAVPVATPPCAGAQHLPAECSTIEFQVYKAAGSIAEADADIMIQPDTGWGDMYWYWPRLGMRQHSDSAGYFVLKSIPPATLTVKAWVQSEHFWQPCAAIFKSPNAAVTRIQLFSVAEFDTVEAPRPSNATEPALVGTIYETTPEGRRPVSGANMMASYPSTDPYWQINESGVASTRSSREGHYFLCRLPTEFQIYVWKEGFEDAIVHPGVVSAGVPFDIELRRSGS